MVPLEESVAIYERGEALKRRCEELLRQAEARVDKITTDANGQVNGNRTARHAVTAWRPRVASGKPKTRILRRSRPRKRLPSATGLPPD